MSKHLFANEKVMKQYLGALLQEDEPQETALAPVAKLLERVPEITETELNQPVEKVVPDIIETQSAPVVESPEVVEIPEVESKDLELTKNNTIIKEEAIVEPSLTSVQEEYGESEFQALFFEVAGLTLAVPLKSLGGIHQLGEVTQLFGKPKWFKGVMLNREEKLNVVDTARWVMPEKYTPELEEKLDYQYLITLGDSPWGLLAENLINNITLKPEDIKWRVNGGKRPWLAGVIKEKMCALIDVENLNRLLEQGLDSQEQ
ncbi:chemotaxis protein CheW [Pseudoalteromonas phenolica]|uniref:Chemotaxis protein W n=1 Tax=Pseudoalteromonas phenolica TaxID=161398 RepID=A0A0S2JZL9_9GAMM|nr:chemotaxis protein CheW [Pseudoalteromonas phenolica]ALO41478.1 chemotaxis protein W [Pseudoalteromonas phenolica]MBE0353975.1 purine-binding chemotaxis protein CheW [Pseudoalteromonas phenolica O-BC30]